MLFEGLEKNDLKRLVHTEMHIDEFKSKLGRDEDVCVLSFKVDGKEPALDLVNFIEKGYPWVIDADVSSGEMDDGDYIVFVECERDKDLPDNVISMMEDIMNVTDQEISEWRVRYQSGIKDHELSAESIKSMVPLTPEEYLSKYGQEDIDKLKTAAGVDVDTKAPKNDFTESLRSLAGIIR
jgi:hypothetical protein